MGSASPLAQQPPDQPLGAPVAYTSAVSKKRHARIRRRVQVAIAALVDLAPVGSDLPCAEKPISETSRPVGRASLLFPGGHRAEPSWTGSSTRVRAATTSADDRSLFPAKEWRWTTPTQGRCSRGRRHDNPTDIKPARNAPAEPPPLRRFQRRQRGGCPRRRRRGGSPYDDGISRRPDAPSRRRLGSVGERLRAHSARAATRRRRRVPTRDAGFADDVGVDGRGVQGPPSKGHRAHPEEDQIFDDMLKAAGGDERAWLELLPPPRRRVSTRAAMTIVFATTMLALQAQPFRRPTGSAARAGLLALRSPAPPRG